MKLIKTSLFSAVITCVRIASGFVSSKVVAIVAGPGGVAVLGAFSNFVAIVLTFANGAINNGVVKYTAEFDDDELQLKKLFSTSLKISVFCSIIIGVILFLFSTKFSIWILSDSIYSSPIKVLGITIIFYSLNSLLISILNGKGQIKSYTLVNTIGSLIGLVFTIVLVYFYKISGALYAIVLAQSIVFFVTALLIIKSDWFSWDYFKQAYDKVIAIKLSHFTLMSIVAALTLPISQILLRNFIINESSIANAGIWQGMMRISDGYLMIVSTSLITYYLPKLSSIKEDEELRNEIFKGYKVILPTIFLGCVVIFFMRFIIIRILFTPEFLIMERLFVWQLIGDFFKSAAMILAYIMVAKAMTKTYIFTEIFFSIGYVLLGYVLLKVDALNGATIAFALNYMIYLVIMVIIFRKLIFRRKPSTLI